jgi:hypothetical protein
MKYIAIGTLHPGTFNATIQRFMEAGGLPPKGVNILGRWHGMSGQGVAICEAEDPKAMFEWRVQWGDLLEMTITPCLDDADTGVVLASMARR